MWRVELDDRAARELRRLDRHAQAEILRYLRERLATAADPRRFGKSMRGDQHGLWRYRIGDHRVIAQIQNAVLVVFVVRVGHRKDIYDF